ncbi:MAG: acyl-CoA dehydratase activase-related protein [Candidatus Gastranaerophilales bacterium]|nr:acyl-CoA dehydratase activase-related protein [Candidatus Gastranaerophilales bacterium]
MKIGIPRALTYHNYYPFWYGFFNKLGIEVVLSDKTTKQIVSKGSSKVVPETCLPVKIYVGHVLNLLDKGIDKIYCPSIQSIDNKIYNCSKIRGLPDLIRNVVKRDFTLIEPTLDKSDDANNFYIYLQESVKPFGITDKKLIKEASKVGWACINNYNLMRQSGVEHNKALSNAIKGRVVLDINEQEYPIHVAVVSHGYNLYDDHSTMKALQKLEKLEVKAHTAEELSIDQMKNGIKLLDTELYWANEHEMTGAAGHYLNRANIDGVISITAFGCGPDSLMIDRITRKARVLKKPLLNLTIDEHTGEAGFVTRLEAFTDMLFRKKRASILQSLNEQIPEPQVIQKEDNDRVSR